MRPIRPEDCTLQWSSKTVRRNRAFNQAMDRISVAIMLFGGSYLALAVTLGWINS